MCVCLNLNKAISFNANLQALSAAEKRVFRWCDLTKVARKLHNSRRHFELMGLFFLRRQTSAIVDGTIQNWIGSFLFDAALEVKTTVLFGFSEILSP